MNPYREDITYWPPGTTDGFGGRVASEPVMLKGRWEDRQEQFLDADQRIQLSNAIVFFPFSVCETIEVDGYMFPGASDETDPTELSGAFLVRQKLVTPDLRRVRNELRVVL